MDFDFEKTPLISNETYKLSVDRIKIPPSSISYESIQQPLTVSWHNLIVKKSSNSNRLILNNISGFAKSGQFVALMGSRFVYYFLKVI